MTQPLHLLVALHLHQPVGNFDNVFAEHVHDVYRPLLRALQQHPECRVAVHLSGPLLDWSLDHAPALVDELRVLVCGGQAELLYAGHYEPILASLPRADRLQQLAWHVDAMHRVFGAPASAAAGASGTAPRGIWLTERVWEPDLARDLADAGMHYALLDDWGWLAAGHAPETLAQIFRTEHDGRTLDLVPIHESLRYLIPFRSVADIEADLRARHARGDRLAVFADDAEKFGGWPGTRAWVLESGWLDEFLGMLTRLQLEGVISLAHGHDLMHRAPRGGLAYLPSASYREMEEWALPLDAARPMASVRAALPADATDTMRARVRGSHWKHFLVKYPEANRLHKHMLALSALCRAAGDPDTARRAIGMAQSNDPLWHGVFGGLYLPWLRHANWHHVARAERVLRAEAPLEWERRDLDMDGYEECWVHSARCSVVIAPHRGASIETWLDLAAAVNVTDTLTRRIEPYHLDAFEAGQRAHAERAASHAARNASHGAARQSNEGTPSIHEIEHALTLDALPPADRAPRVLLQLSAMASAVTATEYASARHEPIRAWHDTMFICDVSRQSPDDIAAHCTSPEVDITIGVHANGSLSWSADWSRADLPDDAVIAVELSHAPLLRLNVAHAGDTLGDPWRYPIETLAKSERGLERTVQGIAQVWRAPVRAQRLTLQLTLDSAG